MDELKERENIITRNNECQEPKKRFAGLDNIVLMLDERLKSVLSSLRFDLNRSLIEKIKKIRK